MLSVKPLSEDEIISLKSMNNCHPRRMSRVRAAAIILSNKGYSVSEIADINGVCRQSAAKWINLWENAGIAGLIQIGKPPPPAERHEKALPFRRAI